jgi:hypothetical protein
MEFRREAVPEMMGGRGVVVKLALAMLSTRDDGLVLPDY